MKRRTIIISAMALAAVAAVSACKRSEIQHKEAGQIVVNSSVEGSVISRGVVDNAVALSDIQFLRKDDANNSLSTVNFSGVTPMAANRPKGDNTEIVFNPKQVYDPYDNKTTYLAAYHPAGTVAANVVSWTPDGTVDIISSNLWNGGNQNTPSTASMVFKHELARIEILLQAKTGLDATIATAHWGKVTAVKLINVPTTLTYSYATATAASGTAMGVVNLLKGNKYETGGPDGVIKAVGNTEVQFASMIAPMSGKAFRIDVTTNLNGVEKVAQLNATLSENVAKGKVHTLTLTFGYNNEITVSQSGIRAWDNTGNAGKGDLIDPDAVSVLVGKLRWATGNLVAAPGVSGAVAAGTNGTKVRIGAPTDGGLYFQFGSLIGWKGGNLASAGSGEGIYDGPNSQYWNGSSGYSWANEAKVWPSAFTTYATSWPKDRSDTYSYFGLKTTPYDKSGQKLSDFEGWESGALVAASVAAGDPCRYYLGSPWRMPTMEEFGDLFNNVYPNVGVGAWSNLSANWPFNEQPPINGKLSNSILAGNGYNASLSDMIGHGIYTNTTTTVRPNSITEAAPSSLFFAASGYRDRVTGKMLDNGNSVHSWSASVGDGVDGIYLSATTSRNAPHFKNKRDAGLPVRCVSDFVLTSDKKDNTVDMVASTFRISILGGGMDSWTVSEESDVESAFVASPLSGRGDGTFNVSVAKSNVAYERSAVYKVTTASGVSTTITLKQKGAESLVLDGLRWAGGNLIANGSGGAKIGGAYDIGLYFKFGSLIGWSGGDNGDGTGLGTRSDLAIMAKPSNYKGVTDFVNIPYYSFPSDMVYDVVYNVPKAYNVAGGIGDPCYLYLGGAGAYPPWKMF